MIKGKKKLCLIKWMQSLIHKTGRKAKWNPTCTIDGIPGKMDSEKIEGNCFVVEMEIPKN